MKERKIVRLSEYIKFIEDNCEAHDSKILPSNEAAIGCSVNIDILPWQFNRSHVATADQCPHCSTEERYVY